MQNDATLKRNVQTSHQQKQLRNLNWSALIVQIPVIVTLEPKNYTNCFLRFDCLCTSQTSQTYW